MTASTEFAVDKEGFLLDLGAWSEEVAATLASGEKIELGEQHWQVITVLRTFFNNTETSPAMRPFVNLIKRELGPELGNSMALMQLFGASPAKIAAKIAGLPRPTNCL